MAGDTKEIRAAGLELTCPTTWAVLEDVQGAALVLVPTEDLHPGQSFSATLSVMVAPGGAEDDDTRTGLYVAAFDQVGQTLDDAVLLDASDTIVSGYHAKRVLATYVAGARALTLDQWLVPRREDHLVITGTSRNAEYPGLADEFESITTSIREAS